MKRAAEILEYLARPDTPHSVLIAPNAPPVTRTPSGLDVALNLVLDAGDIYDTLRSLLAQAGLREDQIQDSGTFCFAVPSVGRFRVHYATQRGSKVATISHVPFEIPTLDQLCVDPDQARRLAATMSSGAGGIVAITGPRTFSNNALVYALIREINTTRRLVIYILERALTFLVSHGDSIVIQAELNSDVDTFEHGLSNAFMFDPDLLFIGDVRPTDTIPSLAHATGSGILTIISSVSVPGSVLLRQHTAAVAGGSTPSEDLLRLAVRVLPQPNGRALLIIEK